MERKRGKRVTSQRVMAIKTMVEYNITMLTKPWENNSIGSAGQFTVA
jgi:hypothetical protein